MNTFDLHSAYQDKTKKLHFEKDGKLTQHYAMSIEKKICADDATVRAWCDKILKELKRGKSTE